MSGKPLFVALVSVGALCVGVAARQAAPPQEGPFVGADVCRTCHTDYYDAWSGTKHARTINRLSATDRAGGCIRCHVTGTPEMIATDGATPRFPNVQCEACHGAGRAHVDAARAGDATLARTDRLTEATCTRCHNENSPHYKTFIYRALVGLVHPGR
jgi:hypothetical protein